MKYRNVSGFGIKRLMFACILFMLAPVLTNGQDLPVITADGPLQFCEGGSVRLTASAGYTAYIWSNGASSRSITVTKSGTFTVTGTRNTGIKRTSLPVTVFVSPFPEPEITVLGSTQICEGEFVILDAGPDYQSYKWNTGAGTRRIQVSKGGTFTVEVTNEFGCRGTADPVRITAHPPPAKPTITQEGGLLTSTPSIRYQWYRDGFAVPGAVDRTYQPAEPGTFTVEAVNVNGCSAFSDPFDYFRAQTTISIPPIVAMPGEEVTIPVFSEVEKYIQDVDLSGFSLRLRFKKHVFYPTDGTLFTDDDSMRTLIISGTYESGTDTLVAIEGLALWSHLERSDIEIVEFSWTTDFIRAPLTDGEIIMALCDEGGTRLYLGGNQLTLSQNRPNPFNSSAVISYELVEEGETSLRVFDRLGRSITTLVDDYMLPGRYEVRFDAAGLPSGTYFYVLTTPTQQRIRHMRLVK
ncbi:MAG: hypothetical protein CL946_05525 [Ectothiorhodospiraceae bacterium]|nr:hypothetical protein [Ectothiorhodospiraceae bacterium]